MRIAQVTPVYPPYRGGIGTAAFDCTERLRDRGHEVHVFTPKYKNFPEEAKYIHRLRPIFKWGNAGFIPSLLKEIKDFDVIHLHYPFFGGAELLLASKKPVIITYHMDVVSTGWKGKIFELHRKLLMPRIMKKAKTVLVSSRDYAEDSFLSGVLPIESLNEVPFAVDANRFQPGNKTELRSKFGLPEDAVVAVFVGGMDQAHYFKGVEFLIEAMNLLKETNLHLLLAGEGDMRPEFERRVKALGLTDRVHFTGSVSDEDLPLCYRTADFHVLPAIDRSEAFGIVTLEAAASGIPSVVSNLPGVRTVIVEGQTGLLVRPADANDLASKMNHLVRDQQLREDFGARARKRILAKYTWSVILDILEGVYKKVI